MYSLSNIYKNSLGSFFIIDKNLFYFSKNTLKNWDEEIINIKEKVLQFSIQGQYIYRLYQKKIHWKEL